MSPSALQCRTLPLTSFVLTGKEFSNSWPEYLVNYDFLVSVHGYNVYEQIN